MARTIRMTAASASAPKASATRRTTTVKPTVSRRTTQRSAASEEKPARPARTTRTTAASKASESRPASSGARRGRMGGRGFGSWNKTVKESQSEYNNYRTGDDIDKIVFLEDEPFANVWRHWVQTLTEDGRPVRVPRNCIGDDCPLCGIEDEPKPFLLFNVVDLSDPTKVLMWEAGKEIARRIGKRYDELAAQGKTLNDPSIYFTVSKEKKSNGFTEYSVDVQKVRDLEEDWGLQPLGEDDIDSLSEKLYTEDTIKFNTVEELQDFVDSLPE